MAGYIIYYGTASGLYDKSVDAKDVTTYTLTDLDLCTRYYVVVEAYDYSGNISDYSNEVNGFPKGTPPAAIAVSPAGTITTATPTYTWNAVCSSTSYLLWVDDSTGNKIQKWYTAADAGCASGTGTCSVTPTTVLASGAGEWKIQAKNSGDTGPWSSPMSFTVSKLVDFDGDVKADVAAYDVANGWWFIHNSKDGSYVFDAIGVGGGSRWKPVAGDYDGDGKTDVAVYDAQDGWWLFQYTAGGYFYDHIGVGGTGYSPVPGDYDGDGVTDIAVYNVTNGYWYIKYSGGGYGFDSLGGTGSIPIPADYDGDGKTDVAVYDVANGWWYLHYSKDGSYVFDAIGVGGGSQWRPVPGDYDGDGKADVAVYDAQNGWWLFHYTAGSYFYDHIGVGGTGYGGVPGDYDGDGVTDIAVYNETNGYWYVKYSSGGYGFDSLGGSGSVPVNPPYLFGLAF